ncbi:O-methyltransferase, putative [Synechococcus sp. PCC 7335]|uniref:methyltransferase n=1 Tax=Synechococcus sp. (strain ATCC 29403 / PCC 7335) TaxID=91464 RepID=UPI00017EE472|nr:methyltransferase [Synechococcus sp. PCC 7335]EDX84454.1 O-methyltransferase, putative [Synechococcus sp. PCC 7335]
MTTIQNPNSEAKQKVFDLMLAFVKSQCLYVSARLGIFDLLDDSGEQSVDSLAEQTNTDADRLYFILRGLAHVDILEEKPGRIFAPTEASSLLVTNKAPSAGHLAMHLIEPAQWDAWKVLPEALEKGVVPFELANGKGVYPYCYENEWSKDTFIKAMSFLTDSQVEGLLEAYDFGQYKCVMDVGGGQGGLIASIVKRYGCKGILFDLPDVAHTAKDYIAKRGVDPDVIEIKTGNVFESIPQGADAIVMKHFISAWSDVDAKKILANCKVALPADGRLILLQSFVPDIDEPKIEADGIMPGIFAVQINVATPGGGWRTKKQFQTLFEESGFKLERTIRTSNSLSGMEFSVA